MDGSIVAVRWNNRHNKASESTYSAGNGGTIVLEIRRNNPSIDYPPSGSDPMAPLPQSDPNLLGKSARRGPADQSWRFSDRAADKPGSGHGGAALLAGLPPAGPIEYVSINSAYLHSPIPTGAQGPGGPYYGDAPRIARAKNGNWQHYDGTHAEESRHLVIAQFLYRLPDGREIWSGFGSISARGGSDKVPRESARLQCRAADPAALRPFLADLLDIEAVPPRISSPGRADSGKLGHQALLQFGLGREVVGPRQ